MRYLCNALPPTLTKARESAKKNLKDAQSTMKRWYDKHAKRRSFDVVLVQLLIPGDPLQAKYSCS